MTDDIKQVLEYIIETEDPYGLKPETLYENIKNSIGTPESLAEIFGVPIDLVVKIKED
jgi:hypothetical protein